MTTVRGKPAKRWRAAEARTVAMIPLGIRLAEDIVARVDAHGERLKQSSPGLTVTRTDAIRVLLLAALDEAESRR